MSTHVMSTLLREVAETIKHLEAKVEEVRLVVENDDGWLTVRAFANRNGLTLHREQARAVGINLSAVCRTRGIEPLKVDDYQFDYVNAYPRAILEEHRSLFDHP